MYAQLARLRYLFGTLLMLVALPALTWTSSLLPYDSASNHYVPATVRVHGENWRIPDTSYAGYRLGSAALASDVVCSPLTVRGTGDITDSLQNVVDQVGQAGGGVVYIPAGHFTISASISVPYSNVSIEGAGSDKTFISVPSSYDQVDTSNYDEGLFTIGRSFDEWRQGWWNQSDVVADVTGSIDKGDTSFSVADASELTAGQWVVAVQYFWPALSAANSTTPYKWPSISGFPAAGNFDRMFSFVYLRQITAISGTTVTVDAPFPQALDTANNPIKLRDPSTPSYTALRKNSGISGLSIRFADNDNGKNGRPGGSAVLIDGMRDAWAYDVHVRNFPRFGFRVTHSARITVADSAVFDMQDAGGGGWGYAFAAFAAQNVLFFSNYAEEMRSGYNVSRAPSSMNVFSGNTSYAAREGGDDTHYSLAQATVFDNHRTGYGTGVRMLERGSASGGAYETSMGGILWNIRGDGRLGGYNGGAVLMNPASKGRAIVVGVAGMQTYDLGPGDYSHPELQLLLPHQGPQVGDNADGPGLGAYDQNVLYDGVRRPDVMPASLYEAQLKARTGHGFPGFGSPCGRQPRKAQIAPSMLNTTDYLIFDSDHLGSTPYHGRNCRDCDVDSTARNATASGQESMSILASSKNYDTAAHFRGALLQTKDVRAVSLMVYPTAPNLTFRLALKTLILPNFTQKGSESRHVVGPFPANQWSEVVIDDEDIAVYQFNTAQISSVGPQSAKRFYIDDIVARKKY